MLKETLQLTAAFFMTRANGGALMRVNSRTPGKGWSFKGSSGRPHGRGRPPEQGRVQVRKPPGRLRQHFCKMMEQNFNCSLAVASRSTRARWVGMCPWPSWCSEWPLGQVLPVGCQGEGRSEECSLPAGMFVTLLSTSFPGDKTMASSPPPTKTVWRWQVPAELLRWGMCCLQHQRLHTGGGCE